MRAADERRFLVMVTLGKGVPVQADLLGTSWQLPDDAGLLVLPSPPDGGSTLALLRAPPIEHADRALTWFTASESTGLGPWGVGSGWQYDTLTEAWVRRGLVMSAARPFETTEQGRDIVDAAARVLDRWIESFCVWLELIAYVDMQPRHDDPMTPRHVFPLSLAVDPDGSMKPYPTMSQSGHSYRSPHHVSNAEWRAAFARANDNRRPPEAHLLLRDSRAAADRRDNRKAVIDAATAVEVALGEAIRDRLVSAPDATSIERLLRNSSGVIELFDLAVALGVEPGVSVGQVAGQLAGARNAAVHRGQQPTAAETTAAQQTASAIVGAVCPL